MLFSKILETFTKCYNRSKNIFSTVRDLIKVHFNIFDVINKAKKFKSDTSKLYFFAKCRQFTGGISYRC
jgi:hypothetical protein